MRKLALLLAIAALVGGDIARAAELRLPATDTPVGATLPSLPQAQGGPVDLGVALDRALAAADQFPVTDYDPEALAASLDGDPLAAFAYVRDRIALDPYGGALRGPAGVLGARAGSSTDQAMLLVDLLQRMGIEARYAFGTLDPQAVGRLRAAALAPRPAVDNATIGRLAGLSPAAEARLTARAERDFAWLMAAVGTGLAPTPPADPTPRHVWVQARIDGAWTDLDPSLPDTEAGTTVATLGATADALPDQLVHRVRVALVAESLAEDGTLTTATVLEAEIAAPQVVDGHVFLAFLPADGGGMAAIGTGIVQALGEAPAYRPVLAVGDHVIQGTALPALSAGPADTADAGDGGFGAGGFGDAEDFFFGGGGAATAPAGPELTALYLDVATFAPWAEPTSRRRPLLDRVMPAMRQAGGFTTADLVPVPIVAGLPAPLAAIHQIAVSTGGTNPHYTATGIALAAGMAGTQLADPAALAALSLPEVLWPIGALNDAFVLASERLAIAALNDRPDVRFFVGSPRVTVLSFQPTAVADGQGLSASIDLMIDTVAAVAAIPAEAAAVAERRIWYGVVQSALETTLAEVRTVSLAGDEGAVTSTSTAMTPELDVLAPGSATANAPAALQGSLDAGALVVVNAGRIGPDLATWWTVDPADGNTRAVLAPTLGGSNYVNGSGGGPRYVIDPDTLRTTGEIRDGTHYRYRTNPPRSSCRGGSEYVTILGCVSIPASVATGLLVGVLTTIIVGSVASIIYSLTSD